MRVWLFLLLASLLSFACCAEGQTGPARPAGVPKTAFWVGGEDGGVFVRVREVPGKTDTYRMTVYNDSTGKILYQGLAQLRPVAGEKLQIRDPKAFSGWDGEKMLLTDGRVLAPVKKSDGH
jgi:hypothetical protein